MKQFLKRSAVSIGFAACTAVSLNIGAADTSWVESTQYDQIKASDSEGETVGMPISAAAWMFGSALLGFVGFATRKRRS